MDSPFNRSSRTARTPPASPAPGAIPVPDPRVVLDVPTTQGNEPIKVMSTPEIEKWLGAADSCLNEVCHIATVGKLNADQKLQVSTLCRKVSHEMSKVMVQYQALKCRMMQAQYENKALQDQIDLSIGLKEIKRSIDESSKSAPVTSFAEMVKKGNNNFVQTTNLSSVAIYPKDKLKSSEETKSLVQKIIRPEELKLHVRGMRKTRNGGVIISTDNKDDIEKLRRSTQLTHSDLTVDEPRKRKPRIVILGVSSSMPEKDLLNCLYHQNLEDKIHDVNLETFMESVKLSHKSGKKDSETCNFVIEVSSVIRKALISQDRVFINWSSCPVRDFTLVTRCYKCQQYGHAAKSCREPVNTCGHCGELGHSIKECTKTTEEPKCATCHRFKKPSNHSTGAADCPAKLMAEKRLMNSTDYGGA